LRDVAPEALAVNAQFFLATTDHRAGANPFTQRMHRLPQRVPRVRLVELRPEQGKQGIPAVEASGSCGGEIGEERDALRPAQHRREVASGVYKVEGSQQLELEHLTAA